VIGSRTVLLVGYAVVALLPLALFLVVPIRRDKPGGTGLLLILPGSSLWSVGTAAVVLDMASWLSMLGNAVVLLGASFATIGWFVMVLEYTGVLSPTRSVFGVLAIEPVLAQVFFWLRPHTELVCSRACLIPFGWMHIVVNLGFVTVGSVIIVKEILASSTLRRKQSLALFGSVIPPVAAELLRLFDYLGPEMLPFAYLLSIPLISWALFSARFLDIVPIARERVLDTVSDPVVVIDDDGRVLESNPAARELVGVDPDHVGTSCREFFSAFPDAIDRLRSVGTGSEELRVEQNGTEHHFDVEISPIQGPNRQQTGRVFVFRDVTRLKHRERELREREQELDLMRQVQSRVLRHNIRNDLTVVKGYNEVFVEELDDEYAEMAEIVIEKTDDLISISHKARAIEELVEQDQTPREMELAATLENLVETYRQRFPEVTFTLDRPETCLVTVAPAVELGFANLLENAAEHNDATEPTVEVTLPETPEGPVVTISDNGPGVPEEELAVIEEGEETQLEHGSGIGLWIVEWIVDKTSATVEYETGTDGTTVTVRIAGAD